MFLLRKVVLGERHYIVPNLHPPTFPSLSLYPQVTQRCINKTSSNAFSKCNVALKKNMSSHVCTLSKNYSKYRTWYFQFCYCLTIFLSMPLRLVTLFDCKQQVVGFSKTRQIDHFWHFWWTFVHSKYKGSSLRSQCWVRLFLRFLGNLNFPALFSTFSFSCYAKKPKPQSERRPARLTCYCCCILWSWVELCSKEPFGCTHV